MMNKSMLVTMGILIGSLLIGKTDAAEWPGSSSVSLDGSHEVYVKDNKIYMRQSGKAAVLADKARSGTKTRIYGLVVSPDEKYLAYVCQSYKVEEVKTSERLPKSKIEAEGLALVSQKKVKGVDSFIYEKRGKEEYEVILQNMANKTSTTLHRQEKHILFPSFSPDGKYLGFLAGELDNNPASLYLGNADGSNLKRYPLPEGHYSHVVPLPTESSVIVVYHGEKACELRQCNLGNGEYEILVSYPGKDINGLCVSSDGKQIAYMAGSVHETKMPLYVISLPAIESKVKTTQIAVSIEEKDMLLPIGFWGKDDDLRLMCQRWVGPESDRFLAELDPAKGNQKAKSLRKIKD